MLLADFIPCFAISPFKMELVAGAFRHFFQVSLRGPDS
jgi:hypothetical protein